MRFRPASRRHTLLPAVSSDVSFPLDDESPTATPDTPAEAAMLRVGDYEVGDGFCVSLCGHPEIRY